MLTYLLLAAGMLPGFAGNVEDSGIALEVNTGHPVHIVRDETERPVFVLRNTVGSDCELRGFLVLEDLFGHVLKLSVETNLTGGAECHVQGLWPLPAKGLWTVRFASRSLLTIRMGRDMTCPLALKNLSF